MKAYLTLALVAVLRPRFFLAESLAFPFNCSVACCKREVVQEIFLLYVGADVTDDLQGCSGVHICAHIPLACSVEENFKPFQVEFQYGDTRKTSRSLTRSDFLPLSGMQRGQPGEVWLFSHF